MNQPVRRPREHGEQHSERKKDGSISNEREQAKASRASAANAKLPRRRKREGWQQQSSNNSRGAYTT